MKQRKPIKIAALKNIAIIPLLFLHPLSAKAQINDHIIVWLNNIMDPPDIAQRIQQDPSFVTWQANTYYPQPDPTAIAAADSTTLPLDEESVTDFATAASNAVLSVSSSMYMAASNSAARSIGTQPYALNFGGAQRDTLTSLLGIAKAGLTAAIGISVPYQLTNNGKYVVAASGATLSFITDSARFTMQEYLKGYLINKKGFTPDAASWASYAVSQLFGAIMVPVWGYATQVAMAPNFNATTALRRKLLTKINTEANNYNFDLINYNYNMSLYTQTKDSTYYNSAQTYLSAENSSLTNYNNAKAKISAYESIAFPTLSQSTISQVHSLAKDPYPGYKNQFVTPADYTAMMNSIYDGFISRCVASSDGVTRTLSVTCPSTVNYWRVKFTLNPLNQDASGNVTVYESFLRPDDTVEVQTTFQINAKNINTANYH